MKQSEGSQQYRPHKKATYVVVAVILTAAVSGYFMGIQQTGSTIRERGAASSLSPPGASTHSDEADEPSPNDRSGMPASAPSYSEIPTAVMGPNADWESDLRKLVREEPDLFAEIELSRKARLEAVKTRRKLRAFNGAPPVIPHPINQRTSAACLSCHSQNTEIKDNLAPMMPHKDYQSCTQCHVPNGGNEPPMEREAVTKKWPTNRFVGWTQRLEGTHAYSEAPPTIPHATRMRENCLSCHGPKTKLRTTHPWRQSCLQCHAPSAELDQHHFLSGDSPFTSPAQ